MFQEVLNNPPIVWIVVVSVYFVAIVTDWIWSEVRRREVYRVPDVASNVFILVSGLFSRFLLAGWVVFALTLFHQLAIFHFPDNTFGFIASFLLADFLYYWQHRLKHGNRFLWAFHVVHHSSRWLNFTTGFRLSWFDPLIKPFLYAPAVILGADPSAILWSLVLNLLFQFWVHNQNIGRLGVLEWIINTPSNHRVHHGRNPEYIDKNFAGILIIWDRIFGTYAAETVPPDYGVTGEFIGNNPLKIQFQGFVELLRRRKRSRG